MHDDTAEHPDTPAPAPAGDAPLSDLLARWNAGDHTALDAVTPLVYDDLRRLARAVLSREQPGQTLSATALVHEAYLRLLEQRRVRWEDRTHFLAVSAHIMRRVLVDRARARMAAKRGGGAVRVPLDETAAATEMLAEDVLDLDQALSRLAALDTRKVRIVEMKCMAGMTNQEIAAALSVSDATVERDWKFARAWLLNEIGRTRTDADGNAG